MKKYFEYPFNKVIKQKILDFYEDTNIDMHTSQTKLKTKIKLERVFSILKLNTEDVILDVGCSRGELFNIVHSEIKEGIGIDLSQNVIDLDSKENEYKNIKYEVFDGEHISLPIQVDKVFLLDVLEHAFEPDGLMESIYENLRKGGQLILEVPTTGWLSELIFGKYHMGHLRYYDPDSIQNFLKRHNFKIQSIQIFNSVPAGVFLLRGGGKHTLYKIADKICNFIPAKIYPYYGSILVICKK